MAAAVALAACQPMPGPAAPPAPQAESGPAPLGPLAPAEAGIPPHVHIKDVIYERKYGMSLTLDVFQPARPNGAAIVSVDTGGWVTGYDHVWAGNHVHFLERGYTVFNVVHGSSPKFTVPEQIADVRRAVKFIRHHAADYHVDPARVGMTGVSTGGLLSLMMGLTDTADPGAEDPVERMSSRVQAVACIAPVTDLTNVRWPTQIDDKPGVPIMGPFHFLDFMEKARARILMGKGDSPEMSPRIVAVMTDHDKAMEILRTVSPVEQVSAAAAPTMILQGDKDRVVPLDKTERFLGKLKAANVPNKLVVVPDAGHNIPDMVARTKDLADWFDIHLKPQAAPAAH
ncbi:MAG: alpha/beta hydrolase [Minicystis sp.]